MSRYMSDRVLMSSGIKERVAAFLHVNGANEHTGITAKTITDELELTGNVVYRVLKTTGFHQSQLPKWPRGHYYDQTLAIKQSLDKVQAADTIEMLSSRLSERTITESRTNIMHDNTTPVGKLFNQFTINDTIDKVMLEGIASWEHSGKLYTRVELNDRIVNAKSFNEWAGNLLIALMAYDRNIVAKSVPS